jgi:two-component system sensor histidine kinase CiaH
MNYNRNRIRLALTYLAIIMILSVGFSAVFYRESTRAAGFGLTRQTKQLRNNLYFTSPGLLDRIYDDGLGRFRANVQHRLILLNIFMFVAGGAFSYYLAKRSLEPLEAALESQSRFTSDAAHELRTPLTAMKTETEIALRSKKLSAAEARTVLASNLEEVAKLQALTEALLRLARSGQISDRSTFQPVIITDVLKTAVERVRAMAEKRHITFALPPDAKLTLPGDRDQLIELFVVLFENAVTYSPVKTAVTVTAGKNDGSVAIAVKDKGVGIEPKDLPHIFERFYRADQSRTKATAEGYGLGLSVAQAIVKNHKGTIVAESKPGKGTTFTVTLPRS